jgi:hypothetical protein
VTKQSKILLFILWGWGGDAGCNSQYAVIVYTLNSYSPHALRGEIIYGGGNKNQIRLVLFISTNESPMSIISTQDINIHKGSFPLNY